jgi:hypothetical protein
MKWARLNDRNVVVEIMEQEDRPSASVKVPIGVLCAVGLVWNGWEFLHPVFTSYEFLRRFTDAELELIRSYSVHDSAVWRLLSFAQAAQEIDTGDPVTIAGMDYLVSVAILTQARRDAILAA